MIHGAMPGEGRVQLYGVRGWGSAIIEAMLALVGQPYAFVDVAGFDRPGETRDLLMSINPLTQVPALVTHDGEVITENGAIALWLAGRFPALAPLSGTLEHARFLQTLVWLVANVYPTFAYGDYPDRWTLSAPDELVASTNRHRETLYLQLEAEIVGPFALGEQPTAIDCYLAVLVDWRPRRGWFRDHAPKITAVADRMRALPELAPMMRANGFTQASPAALAPT